MRQYVEEDSEFYGFTASLLPEKENAAVSVESLHHFSEEEKLPLFSKLRKALKPGGYFVLTDFYADTDDQEYFFRSELMRLRKEQNLLDGVFYH